MKKETTYKAYKAHGNILTMPHLSAMNWDYKNQLLGATNGTFSSYYVYDASGNRVRKVVEKGNVKEERFYVGDYEVYRKTTSGTLNVERTTVHISDDQKRIAMIDNDGTTETIRYQIDNHLGSASLELDQNADIITYEEYHPFGTTSYRSGRSETETSLKRHKYVGKERDEETGLFYYGARYLCAWIARFISTDPMAGERTWVNPYNYVQNNPINRTDPTGALDDDPPSSIGTSYITADGVEIANSESEERKIIVIYDETTLNNIKTANENGNTFDFSSLTQDQAFELPSYEMRQEIKKEIDSAYIETDNDGNKISDFEIGGFIQFAKEYAVDDYLKQIGSGYYNRMRIEGNKVANNTEQAELPQEIDKQRDPFENPARDLQKYGDAKYTWHTHLNVFFDKNGFKRSYQWKNKFRYDPATKVGNYTKTGERGSTPSPQDHSNIISSSNRIGIVIDMVGSVHLYNRNNTVTMKESTFFNIK